MTSVTDEVDTTLLTDPLKLAALLWPDVVFYDKQAEVIRSVWSDDITVVPAGNMLGKDFVAGRIAVLFFLSRSPCRIVTTSAKDDHLRVLWGEINEAIRTSSIPLDYASGGPLIINHHDIRRLRSDGTKCPLSYIIGMVASTDSIAAMQGHHVANRGDKIPRTLFISDESSSVPHDYWRMASTWANRALILGNTWPCSNFFYQFVKGVPNTDDPGGTRMSKDGSRCYRRVIHIRAEDSPNVRLALTEKDLGREPSGRVIVPGVKSYDEYMKNRETWDPIQQCVSLDADFYEGAELRLCPTEWLQRAVAIAASSRPERQSVKLKTYMGVDTGEGGDDTTWCVINRSGILHLQAMKTPDTSIIPSTTIALMRQFNVRARNVLFDKGGGGKEHVDYLRRKGYKVRAVGFGEPASDPFIVRRQKDVQERTEVSETRYVYKNRRAEIYGMIRNLLNPVLNPKGFGIPHQYGELLRQLRPLPLLFDEEGRIYLPPKDRRDAKDKRVTIKDMIGCSPDESDAFGLSVFAMEQAPKIKYI